MTHNQVSLRRFLNGNIHVVAPTCKSHEVYSDCVNGGCQARNCTQLGKPVPCVLVAKGACIKGCVCESGYLRTDNGTCIPEDQCRKLFVSLGPNKLMVLLNIYYAINSEDEKKWFLFSTKKSY